jgi:hypothetical protein
VREQQPGALRIHGDGVVVVEAGPLVRGEVDHVGEVVGHAGEVSPFQITDSGRDAQCGNSITALGIREAGDAPHVVVGREVPGERERDLPRGSGDEDLLARQHGSGRY